MPEQKVRRPLYIFLDESGDFNFSPTGSKYFILSGLSSFSPFTWYQEIIDLRYKLIESPNNFNIERFHASEDVQKIRDNVFQGIQKIQSQVRVDSVIVQKNKAHPAIRGSERFLPMILQCLLKYTVRGYDTSLISELIFITDTLPVKKEQEAVKKGIKTHLAESFPNNLTHSIFHWDSRSAVGLQVVDYVNWAIHRKWNRNDTRSYELVKDCIKSEFDIFQTGRTYFYQKD